MMLPCADPRDARGLEAGMREIVHAAGTPLILYLKSEDAFGADRDEGLDAIARLLADGTALSIKYAVVRPDPSDDPYLDGLLKRVDRRRVISGMGERPAIEHLRDYKLGGLTTGSGCIAPRSCQTLFEAAGAGDWARAAECRRAFMALEDLRDLWGPARVLHHATELAGVASTGPIPPYVSALTGDQLDQLAPVARALLERDGFDIVGEAADGATALLAERDLRPDVVLLDVRLPDRSGLDVARAIGSLPNGAQVVLTSTADYSHAIEECGARGFVPKALLSGPSLRAALAGQS